MLDAFSILALLIFTSSMQAAQISDDAPLTLPEVGDNQLRILTPTILELTFITTEPAGGKPDQWNFVDTGGRLKLPDPKEFVVLVNGKSVSANPVSFRRRVIYAPLAKRDLRIGNYLSLQLASPISDGQKVEIKNPSGKLWPHTVSFSARADASRYSPAIHVNQIGYLPNFPKRAMVGYYLGSAGELDVQTNTFELIDASSGEKALEGQLKLRRDVGLDYGAYQKVLEADFSEFKKSGEYRLVVPGIGASFPFFIDEGIAAAFARAYALGIYHQRCGTSNALPFTRFVHDACHTAPAVIPDSHFSDSEKFLAEGTANARKDNPRHTASQLKSFATSLYPFVKRGKIDVSGGHHDAGDYSKYTVNCAAFLHTLVFAADALPGVGPLDNLGLPESGDGKSDILQEAKWEADFIAKMQDDDGGFFFLVYPQDRRYENDVLPDHGYPQLVWPKNTAATAAAVAALAETASSPLFKKQFPDAATLYLEKAKKGWAFLERAITKYGSDGAYQKITHYGDDFMHDDELAWAECELFLATGDEKFHKKLLAAFNPSDDNTRRWGWWRLYEAYGRAIRSYAFAQKTGRVKRSQLDPQFLRSCEAEIDAAAQDNLRWSQQSAYGTSFPTETKRFRSGGWYFSSDQAFDLAVGCALDQPAMNDPRPKYLEAILENLNYEAGCNPVNQSYITGLGWKRQRDVVSQYAQNDRRILPPSGIPLGNIQSGFHWMDNYKEELGALTFPSDGAKTDPYPIYDRWSDSFNLQTEFVVLNQARALATAAFVMAKTSLTNQSWRSTGASILTQTIQTNGLSVLVAKLQSDLDLSRARIVWEAENQEPAFGLVYELSGKPRWIEAEAQLPDGRRVFGVTNSSTTFRAAR
jgi:hypothetical protein